MIPGRERSTKSTAAVWISRSGVCSFKVTLESIGDSFFFLEAISKPPDILYKQSNLNQLDKRQLLGVLFFIFLIISKIHFHRLFLLRVFWLCQLSSQGCRQQQRNLCF